MKRTWQITDLITAKDGSLSMPKLAGATAHLLFAMAFVKLQIIGAREYNEALWLIYGAFAIGHPIVDKVGAQVAAYKDKQQNVAADAALQPNTAIRESKVEPDGTTTTRQATRVEPPADGAQQ